MVSYYHPNPLSMYQKSHASNLPYASSHSWYPSNYGPPPPHHTANGQYLTAGSGNGGAADGDPVAAYYNPHHHHMFHQASPDWGGHDNFGSQQSSALLTSSMGPSAAHTGASHHGQSTADGIGGGGHLDAMNADGMTNIPPSPPITVNSGCSEMSSPGIANGGGGMGGSDDASPHLTGIPSRPSTAKSPYEWMKKPSFHSHPQPGSFI